MRIKTEQKIVVTQKESESISNTLDFIENLIHEMNKFTISDNGMMISGNGNEIVNKSKLIDTYATLESIMRYITDINFDYESEILFVD